MHENIINKYIQLCEVQLDNEIIKGNSYYKLDIDNISWQHGYAYAIEIVKRLRKIGYKAYDICTEDLATNTTYAGVILHMQA